uniref:Uncharacterized protein n=1 Tax=Anguilla anguilla TaxID=7936 RepID=A0A0E9QBI8_ANGAN
MVLTANFGLWRTSKLNPIILLGRAVSECPFKLRGCKNIAAAVTFVIMSCP